MILFQKRMENIFNSSSLRFFLIDKLKNGTFTLAFQSTFHDHLVELVGEFGNQLLIVRVKWGVIVIVSRFSGTLEGTVVVFQLLLHETVSLLTLFKQMFEKREPFGSFGGLFFRIEFKFFENSKRPVEVQLAHVRALDLFGSKRVFRTGNGVLEDTVLVGAFHVANEVGTVLAGSEAGLDLMAFLPVVLERHDGVRCFEPLGIGDVGGILVFAVQLVGLSF